MSSGFAHPVQPQPTRPVIVQATALSERLQACFATLEDPRVKRTRLHLLSDDQRVPCHLLLHPCRQDLPIPFNLNRLVQ